MNLLSRLDYRIALLASGVIVLSLWVMTLGGYSITLPTRLQLPEIQNRLMLLLFASLCVERAVEVIVTPWRGPGARSRELLRDQAAPANRPVHEAVISAYRGETQRFAFWISFAIGVILCAGGVRLLGWFLDPPAAATVPPGVPTQASWFQVTDVVVSAMVLGGGADGVHKILSVFFDFLGRMRQPASADSPAPAAAAPIAPAPAAAGGSGVAAGTPPASNGGGSDASGTPAGLRSRPAHAHDPGA